MTTANSCMHHCPLCHNEPVNQVFIRRGNRLAQCSQCGLVFRDPMPGESEIASYYAEGYHDYWQKTAVFASVCAMKEATADFYLEEVARFVARGSLLDIGCSFGQLLTVARRRGYSTVGLELAPEAVKHARTAGFNIVDKPFELAGFTERSFQVITMIDIVEHIPTPLSFMKLVTSSLAVNGALVVVTPDIRSLPARFLGSMWSHYQREHLCYYSAGSLRFLLETAGLEVKLMKAGRKALTAGYILNHFRVFNGGIFGRTAHWLERWLPKSALNRVLWFRTELMAIATRRA